jgi:hypothetical protein
MRGLLSIVAVCFVCLLFTAAECSAARFRSRSVQVNRGPSVSVNRNFNVNSFRGHGVNSARVFTDAGGNVLAVDGFGNVRVLSRGHGGFNAQQFHGFSGSGVRVFSFGF